MNQNFVPIFVRSCCNVYTIHGNDCFWLLFSWCGQTKTKQSSILLLLSFTKIAVSVLILRLKAKCLLKNCAVYSWIFIEYQLLQFWAQNYFSKICCKNCSPFWGTNWPLNHFWTRHFKLISLQDWRNGAAWLKPCYR